MPQKSYTLGNLLQDCLDCDIRKSDIRQFFDDLKKKAHFVYAILCGAPKAVVWITLDDEESHPDERHFQLRSLTTITKTSTAASILSGLISMPIFFASNGPRSFPNGN